MGRPPSARMLRPMIIDQNELDAMKQAGKAADPARPATGAAQSDRPRAELPPNVARLMRLRVPLVARLVNRRMAIGTIRSFSTGLILEFDKRIDHPIELLVSHRVIAHGEAVKVGERFGLRITSVEDTASRVRSLAAADSASP